jgi:hypothetical protein
MNHTRKYFKHRGIAMLKKYTYANPLLSLWQSAAEECAAEAGVHTQPPKIDDRLGRGADRWSRDCPH